MVFTLTGHLAPADKETSDYTYVPFDVPPNIARIDVRYFYSHPRHHGDFEGQGNTIDIGLFDSNGYDFLNPRGFRGWSGSDRDHIWVGATDADTAPGYLSGPLPAGTWHVILGLYRIADEGCDWTITIDLHEPVNAAASTRVGETVSLSESDAHPEPARWYRGDLQSHTHHSDGKGSLATLVATARARGLEFLAVTDHNTTSHIREYTLITSAKYAEQANPSRSEGEGSDLPLPIEERNGVSGDTPLLLIPATEVTTYYGHLNVWGIREWVDFRAGDPQAMAQIIAAAHAQGALVSVNHPKTGGPPWEYGGDLDFDCIEVWQAPWPFYNAESFAWWESLLLQGRRIVAVGGSDYHQPINVMEGNPHLPGHPTTWIYAESLATDAILDGIRHGRVFISFDVNGPMLYFKGSVDHTGDSYHPGDVVPQVAALDLSCEVHGAGGYFARIIADGAAIDELPIDTDNWQHTWRALPRPRFYIRAEVIIRPTGDSDWLMAACSNPLYF